MTRDGPRDLSEISACRTMTRRRSPARRASPAPLAAAARGQQRETEGWCVAGARLEQRMANVGEAARALLAGGRE